MTMLRAREIIQKELFSADRLVCCINVTKLKDVKKKKQATYLCITVTAEKPIMCKLHIVKKAEKGDGYKPKLNWKLSDVKAVNGHFSEGRAADNTDFDITLEKVYKWRAESPSEKHDFLQALCRLCKRHLETQPRFENIGAVEVAASSVGAGGTIRMDDDPASDPLSDLAYQVVTPKEEQDLTRLMSNSELAISDAQRFAEKLSNDLNSLDGDNIHSIVASEEHVQQLMQLIDEAIKEVERVEARLQAYDDVIMGVKEEMERIKDKDDMLKTYDNNRNAVVETLKHLVTSLDLSSAHQRALKDGDLSSASGILLCTEAAEALQRCMEAEIEPTLQAMQAVRDRKEKFRGISKTFATRLSRHLNNLFVHKDKTASMKANTMSTMRPGDLRLKRRHNHHRDLLPYASLMKWLKRTEPGSFQELKSIYSNALKDIYSQEILYFLESVKKAIPVPQSSKHTLSARHAIQSYGSSESIQSVDGRQLPSDRKARQLFDQYIERTFAELTPICVEEQDFCVKFFHLSQHESDAPDDADKGLNAEVKQLLAEEIFPNMDTNLRGFIEYCVKQDSFYSLSLLVHLSSHTSKATSSGTFLSKVYGAASITAKRCFDEYVQTLCQTFKETKATKKSKCGVVSFVKTFEEFADQSEDIFRTSERRSDLDKAYKVLIMCVLNELSRIATEHQKTPRHVILMENFHRIHDVLSRLKISCLESEKREAKRGYNEHIAAYVQEQLGRPMEKLALFFEGVDEQLKSGMKAEEVVYGLAFSKQELRKVIKEYPCKEVKRGIEALYKKVEKHLSDEENLLQVVWTMMQKKFLDQYNLFQEVLNKCYKDSNIELEFQIKDILGMFSEISQSH